MLFKCSLSLLFQLIPFSRCIQTPEASSKSPSPLAQFALSNRFGFFLRGFNPNATLNHCRAGRTISSHLAPERNARHNALVVSQEGRRYLFRSFFRPLCVPLFPSARPLSPWRRLTEAGEARLAAVDHWHLPGGASLCHRPAISCQSDGCH